jgi:hypothetical protein
MRNVSSRPITILNSPTESDMDWPGGSAGAWTRQSDTEPQFVTLQPNEAKEYEAFVDPAFMRAAPSRRKLTLNFWELCKEQAENPWIGAVEVSFGAK